MTETPENDFDLMLDYHGVKSHPAFEYNYTRAQQTQMFGDYFVFALCESWREKGQRISKAYLKLEREVFARRKQ